MSTQPLRVAVLGLGRWGRTWVPVLDREARTVVAATAGGRRDGLELATGVPHHPSWVDAVDQQDLDAVVVTLPVPLHLEAVRRCVERGLHVLVEKPAVANAAELEQLRQVAAEARAAGVVVMVGQNYRERRWAVATRDQVATLGPLHQVIVHVARTEFLDGGRATLPHPLLDDLAIHHLDLLRFFTGQDARVLEAATTRPPWTSYTGEPDVSALLTLTDGGLATYNATWAARGRQTPYDGDWTLRGEHGCVEVRDLTVLRDGDPVPVPAEPPTPDADLAAVLRTFVAAVRDRGPVPTDVEDNARSLGLVFALRDAAVHR